MLMGNGFQHLLTSVGISFEFHHSDVGALVIIVQKFCDSRIVCDIWH